MTSLVRAFAAVGQSPSAAVAKELSLMGRPVGMEVTPGVTFKASFDLMGFLAGIAGTVDSRVYLEGTDWRGDYEADRFIEQYIRANPDLGNMDASVPDIIRTEIASDPLKDTRWVGIHCRNATIAWGVTIALRSINRWPGGVKTGRITCPKVEQAARLKGLKLSF